MNVGLSFTNGLPKSLLSFNDQWCKIDCSKTHSDFKFGPIQYHDLHVKFKKLLFLSYSYCYWYYDFKFLLVNGACLRGKKQVTGKFRLKAIYKIM